MDYGTIMNMLTGLYNQNPAQDYVSTASANINKQTRKRAGDTLSRYATTGMGRSGIQGAAMNDIYSNAGSSLSDVAAKGAEMDFSNKSNLIGQMLQTNQLEDQPSPWASILGQILSGGAQIGSSAIMANALKPTAALAASDEKLKKNIEYTGEETKEGIPLATFKYKGGKKKYKGVIAQDVAKKKPSAVFLGVDYSKLPDAKFEEVNERGG